MAPFVPADLDETAGSAGSTGDTLSRSAASNDKSAAPPESYITGSVSNQDIIFWIYPNSAALQVGRRHRAFGFPKGESLLDTATEFLDAFLKAVAGPDAAARN